MRVGWTFPGRPGPREAAASAPLGAGLCPDLGLQQADVPDSLPSFVLSGQRPMGGLSRPTVSQTHPGGHSSQEGQAPGSQQARLPFWETRDTAFSRAVMQWQGRASSPSAPSETDHTKGTGGHGKCECESVRPQEVRGCVGLTDLPSERFKLGCQETGNGYQKSSIRVVWASSSHHRRGPRGRADGDQVPVCFILPSQCHHSR